MGAEKARKTNKNLSFREKRPLVSVVMPVYNVETYVGEAIESILGQTFSDFEFIIIDDGSADDTWNIIQSCKDERIIALRNNINSGNYPSRNRGMKIAKGKYIAVMDGDDIAMPERLEKQLEIMESDDTLLAHGTASVFSSGQISRRPCSYELLKVMLLQDNIFLHPSLIIQKKIIVELGYYNEYYHFSSDYDLVCKIAQKGKIMNIPDILMRYRLHENQISSAGRTRQAEFAERIRLEYLRGCGFHLLHEEEKIFTEIITRPKNVCISDAIAIVEKIKNQNQELTFLDPVILNKFMGYILSRTAQ
jgi:glycosyltransferase involved in cell wall biosynthesis